MAKALALTSGEPAGIGPDIALKAWLRRDELKLPAFYWLGDVASLERRAKALALNIRLAEVRAEDAVGTFAQALPVVPIGHAATARPGHPDDTSAGAAMASIRQAVADVMAGRAGAVVTNPIAKNVLYRAGFRHPGHTEYLAELAATNTSTPQPVMMLWSPALAVVPTSAGATELFGADEAAHRTLSGIIYFTNNTPDDVEQFPVELFTRDQKRRVAATKPNEKHRFALTDVSPGKYLLKLTWPNQCVLWYRVDLMNESLTDVRILMDVDCAHSNGSIQDLPKS